MGALDVIALVEGVDGDLPVGREDSRQVRPEVEPVEVIGGEQRRQGIEVLLQRGCTRIEADPHEATPSVDLHRSQSGVRGDGIELLPVDDLDQRPVEVVAPGVIAAPDAAVGEAARPVRQASPPVQAGVVERPDGLFVGSDQEDRLVADEVFTEVADVGNFFLPARHLPDPAPETLELQGGEFGAGVSSAGDDVVLADQDAVEVHEVDLLRCLTLPSGVICSIPTCYGATIGAGVATAAAPARPRVAGGPGPRLRLPAAGSPDAEGRERDAAGGHRDSVHGRIRGDPLTP